MTGFVDLRPAEEKFRLAVEASPNGMLMMARDGRMVVVNAEIEQQFGYRREELVGRTVEMLLPKRLRAQHIRHRNGFIAYPLVHRMGAGLDLFGLRKDGTEFPIEVALNPINTGEGLILGVIVDIGEHKRMERLKDEFVSTVSHELRTPLTSISGSLGLLMGKWADKLPEQVARLLTIADQNSQRLLRLINDILDIEKIESGNVVFNLRRIDVRPLLDQVIEANRAFADGHGARIRLDPASVDVEVNADPDRLAQVITNLLSNAIKFSPANAEVLVAVERNGAIARISVRDHGCGVPIEFRPRIFEKFAQADNPGPRQKGGTGLGLSIVKQIVERLGGQVGFDDAPDGGTIFYVELPDCSGRDNRAIALEAGPRNARILVWEGDCAVAKAMRNQLRQAGFDADLARTAAGAVARARTTGYDVVLVDLQPPYGDGIELICRLRAQARCRKAPAIAIPDDPGRASDDVRSSRHNMSGRPGRPVDFAPLAGTLEVSTAPELTYRPRVLHVDNDHNVLAIVARALCRMADVVSVDSTEGARHAIAANHIDLVVLDILLGTESGLDLVSELRNGGDALLPVIIFSIHDENPVGDAQVQVAPAKSHTSLDGLIATVRSRLGFLAAQTPMEIT